MGLFKGLIQALRLVRPIRATVEEPVLRLSNGDVQGIEPQLYF